MRPQHNHPAPTREQIVRERGDTDMRDRSRLYIYVIKYMIIHGLNGDKQLLRCAGTAAPLHWAWL